MNGFVVAMLGASGLALVSTAQAQTETAPQTQGLEEVVVTGSRVIKNGDDSPTPLTVTSVDDILQVQPNTVYQALNNLPQLNNSQGVYANPGGGTQAQAQNTPNLRNLNINGVPRTLVLWDGHRVAPTNPQFLTVDESMIPQMLLQRVDIATGGVSAVYGSDAVAGVINFITDTKFNGVKVNAQGGIAQRAGLDKSSDVGIAGGTNFADGRGHIEGSLEFFNDPGVLYGKLKYPWAQQLWTLQAANSTGPFKLFSNSRTNQYTFGGLIQGAPSAGNPGGGMQFGPGGTLIPFVHGTPTLNGNIEQGGDGGYQPLASLKSALSSQQLFGRADYDFADAIHGFVQGAGTKNHYRYFQGQNTFNETYSATNAFLTPAEQAFLGGAGKTFKMQELPLNIPPTTSEAFEKQYMLSAGLDGAFGDGYKWEVAGSHGYAQQHSVVDFNANSGLLSAALDAVVNPANGQTVCAAALSNPAMYANCVPMDLFGPNSASQASIDYVEHPTEFYATTTMDDVSGSVSGAPLNTWTGPIQMALSGEWRDTALKVTSNSLPTDKPDCTTFAVGSVGRTNCMAQPILWLQGNQANFPRTSQIVSEAAYEFDAPVLKDQPFAEAVNINGAARYTHYSTSGSVWTWKLGLDWHVNDQLTLRATRSRDIRAQNITELFAPPSVGLTTTLDSVTNRQAVQVPRITQANPNLVPEIAQNVAAGFVYKPTWLPNFSLTVDGYDIRINNAIVQIAGDNTTVQQACIASGGSSPYCALMARPFPISDTSADNVATAFYIQPINVGLVRTYGADIEANYATIAFNHPLSVRLLGTYQPHLIQITPGGITNTDTGGVQPTPAERLTALINYRPTDNFAITVTERWRSPLRWNSNPLIIVAESRIPSAAYTNLNLSYTLKTSGFGQTELFFNVQNLFDKWPVVAATTGGSGNPGGGGNSGYTVGDDLVGRYFTVGFHFRM
jgi:iron complex outermembrane receptor protein